MGYVIAKYIRLSVEDSKTESLSIENQHRQLDNFIAELPIKNVTVLEFVDNGYSGTNLERPGLQKLLAMVHAGQVNCIVIKDFSRLARNVIDAGYFVEQIFPLYQVRLVALGDNYDSDENADGAASTMGTTFKFIVNEFYSLELSKKIRASKAHLRKKGLFVTKNCAFGYKLDANRTMVIDEAAAETVRLIYDMVLHGKTVGEIARSLFVQQRPTPSAHKGHQRLATKDKQLDCIWNKSVIYNILHDEQYIGTYVAGKTTPLDVGSKKAIRLDKNEWVRIPDHHPAIVSELDYLAVQRIFLDKPADDGKRKKKTKRENPDANIPPLKGKVYCGGCGRKLRYSPSQNAAFYCRHTFYVLDAPCHRLRIAETELEEQVFAAIQQRLHEKSDDVKPYKSVGGVQSKTSHSYADGMQQLYERLRTGEIDAATYKELAAGITRENDRRRAVAIASNTLAGTRKPPDLGKIRQIVAAAPEFAKEIADALIRRVLVYPDRSVEIEWIVPLSASGQKDRGETAYVG